MTTDPQDGVRCPTCGKPLPSDQPVCRECWSSGGKAPGSSAGAIALGVVVKYRKPIVRVGTRIGRSAFKVARLFED